MQMNKREIYEELRTRGIQKMLDLMCFVEQRNCLDSYLEEVKEAIGYTSKMV